MERQPPGIEDSTGMENQSPRTEAEYSAQKHSREGNVGQRRQARLRVMQDFLRRRAHEQTNELEKE